MKQISEKQKQTATDHTYQAQMQQLSREPKAKEEKYRQGKAERQTERSLFKFWLWKQCCCRKMCVKSNVFNLQVHTQTPDPQLLCRTAKRQELPPYSAPWRAPKPAAVLLAPFKHKHHLHRKREHFKLRFRLLRLKGANTGKHSMNNAFPTATNGASEVNQVELNSK